MSKGINKIIAFLDDAEKAEREEFVKNKKDREELTAKLETLEELQENAGSLEEYKLIAQEIRDTKDFLSYSTKKANEKKSLITTDERNNIIKEARGELNKLQADAAPEIQEKLLEIISLMDNYTEEAEQYESIIMRAMRLHDRPYCVGNVREACHIRDHGTDPAEWFKVFVYMYYQHRETAQRLTRNEQSKNKSFWSK